MAGHNSVPVSGYRIFRDQRFGISANPSVGLIFSPPVESDELFDELRAAYPNLKTHQQRKTIAIIDFLSAELKGEVGGHEAASSNASASKFKTPNVPAKPDQEDFPTSASGSDSQSSSATSPESEVTYQMPHTTQDERLHKLVSTTASPIVLNTTIPAMEGMVSIWRSSDGSAPTRKRRRQMNDRERREYKRRRQEGACESCKIHKRKCTHQSRTDDDVPRPKKRPIRHTRKRKVTLATPAPDGPSPAVAQNGITDSRSFNTTQTSNLSPATLPHEEVVGLTQVNGAQVHTDTPVATGGGMRDQTKQLMSPPSEDGNENEREYEHEKKESDKQAENGTQSEHEKQQQYESGTTTSSEEE